MYVAQKDKVFTSKSKLFFLPKFPFLWELLRFCSMDMQLSDAERGANFI
jgi:hypothetical protein